jgi:hypothetical protein
MNERSVLLTQLVIFTNLESLTFRELERVNYTTLLYIYVTIPIFKGPYFVY